MDYQTDTLLSHFEICLRMYLMRFEKNAVNLPPASPDIKQQVSVQDNPLKD